MTNLRQAATRALSLAQAPDRTGVVGLAHVGLAFGLVLLGGMLSSSVERAMNGSSPALVQMAGYLAGFGGPLVLLAMVARQSPDSAVRLGLRGRGGALAQRVALWGIPAGLILVQAVNVVGLWLWEWAGKTQPKAGHGVFVQMEHEHGMDIALRALTAVVLAPLCEEAFFRGLLQTGAQSLLAGGRPVTDRLRWSCVLGTGLAFGMVHWGAVPLPMLPSLVVFGVVLGWAYERTGCFWVPVAIHGGFNAVSFWVGLGQLRHGQ